MSLSMVRVQQWRAKWEGKLANATESYLNKHQKGNKWALILLPFTVVCRESLESVVFIAGVSSKFPKSIKRYLRVVYIQKNFHFFFL